MEQFGDHRSKGNGAEVAGLGGVIPLGNQDNIWRKIWRNSRSD